VQVSLTFLPPLEREPIVFADASLKGVIVREKRVRVAATASATGIFGLEQGEGAVGRLGGVTQLCFDDACRSSASAAANWILVGPAMLLLNGVGFVARTSDLVALLFEFQSLVPLGREAAQAHGIAGAVGVRFSGPRWAIDVALDAPVGPTGNLPGVLPILAGTYRF
jgi:hypothetical protein